ncbi:uncharacterized protein LOC123035966 [Varanus komodoensis]|uniref:uncharacterized protein LOC123035966 n=1 Tax=Varanus komodoensis TaxID=61221 RepID=UPI001CF7E2DF|nr:uncharacterized protein LOC123035966 [Varanus komodoensis]
MAPRIRLNLAKPLPTISEAFEDILEDITSNTKGFGNVYSGPDSYSGEDYLESICQLSRPTFSIPPESKKGQDMGKPGMLHNSHRILNLSEAPKMVSRYTLPNMMPLEKSSFILDCIKTYSSSRVDPLKELCTEGHNAPQWKRCPNASEHSGVNCSRDNFHGTGILSPQEKNTEKRDVFSFPRIPSPRPPQRESTCPELKCLKKQSRMSALERGPNQEENCPLIVNGKSLWLHPPRETPLSATILRSSQRGQQSLKTMACLEREQLKPSIYNQKMKGETSSKEGSVGNFHINQKGTSHGWISEYQSAWKEAKVRACLLPAIAES